MSWWVVLKRLMIGEHILHIPRCTQPLQLDSRYPLPRPETRMDILRRGLALFPELAPPGIRQQREPTVEDLLPLIIEDACGLRPSRKGGLRLETQGVKTKDGRTVPLIFNYGYVSLTKLIFTATVTHVLGTNL